MIHPDTEVRFISDEVGYGVVVTRPIPRGTVLWIRCLLDLNFTPDQAAALPEPYQQVLAKYAYIEPTGNYVLCWDGGRYVNHSCDPAMLGVGRDFEVAVRDLVPGDQVTCEYGSLNLTGRLACHCGAATCRGSIGGEDVLHLWQGWDRTVAESLAAAPAVPQPLLEFARDQQLFWDYVSGKTRVPSHRAYFAGLKEVSSTPGEALPWSLPSRRTVAHGGEA